MDILERSIVGATRLIFPDHLPQPLDERYPRTGVDYAELHLKKGLHPDGLTRRAVVRGRCPACRHAP